MTNGDAKDIDKSPYVIIVGAGYARRIVSELSSNYFSFFGPTDSPEFQLLFSSSANSVMRISLWVFVSVAKGDIECDFDLDID